MEDELQGWQEPLLIYNPWRRAFPKPRYPTELQPGTREWMAAEQARYAGAKLPTVMGYCTLALAELHLNNDHDASDARWRQAQDLSGYRPTVANKISRDWVREFMRRREVALGWRAMGDIVQVMRVEPLVVQGKTALLAAELADADRHRRSKAPVFRDEAVQIWYQALAADREAAIDVELYFDLGGTLPQPPAPVAGPYL